MLRDIELTHLSSAVGVCGIFLFCVKPCSQVRCPQARKPESCNSCVTERDTTAWETGKGNLLRYRLEGKLPLKQSFIFEGPPESAFWEQLKWCVSRPDPKVLHWNQPCFLKFIRQSRPESRADHLLKTKHRGERERCCSQGNFFNTPGLWK